MSQTETVDGNYCHWFAGYSVLANHGSADRLCPRTADYECEPLREQGSGENDPHYIGENGREVEKWE